MYKRQDKLSRMIDEKAEEEQRFFHRNKAKRNWRWIGAVSYTHLQIISAIMNLLTCILIAIPIGIIFIMLDVYKRQTSGCTAQACNLRDNYADLRKAGYEVIGVSVDLSLIHIFFFLYFR